MPQSLSNILVHVVFSTKTRAPLLSPNIRSELHPYLAAVLNENDCPALQVGGVEDHVHMFFNLSRTLAVAKIVEISKTSSSKWIKTKERQLTQFQWQAGYGAFSVSPSHARALVAYIRNQEEHHRKVSFQEEFRRLLVRYGVTYDEAYVWD